MSSLPIPWFAYEQAAAALEDMSLMTSTLDSARAAVDAAVPVLFAFWDVETLRAEVERLEALRWVG